MEESSMSTPVLLTVKEVAEMLGLSERTVYRLSDAGNMPCPVKLGAAVRWRTKELEAWIEEGCPARHKQPKKKNG
jgi:excisionase family DNA binding protein